MAWGDAGEAAILERAAVAFEAIQAAQETAAAKLTEIATTLASIEAHQAEIAAQEKRVADCCLNGAIRGEIMIETTMQNADKPPAERHAIYEQELSEAGGG